jgi:ligand-binding sensor domain-containing protein
MRYSSHGALRRWWCSPVSLLVLRFCLGLVDRGFAVDKTVFPDVVLHNWDLDDGLPSTRIKAISRTSDGYLWIATLKGLVRFDGTRFIIFDAPNTLGMKDDRASCLLLDSQGNLWAGTCGETLLKREEHD